jgi:hypothetical protein
MPKDARSDYLGVTITQWVFASMGWPKLTRTKSAEGDLMSNIKKIIDELDVDLGILITGKDGQLSMSAAGQEMEDEMICGFLMSKISPALFNRGSLDSVEPANKLPI